MFNKLLPLAITLPILATGSIACSNLSQHSQAAQPQLKQTVSAQQKEEFRKLLIDYYAAYSVPKNKPWNISTAQKFYQKSDRMFGFDFNPPAEGFQGWKAYKTEITKIMNSYSKFAATLGDRFLIYRNGDVVWTISTFNVNGTLKNGTPVTGSGRNTLIWERVGNQWLIAHEHISTPFVPPTK